MCASDVGEDEGCWGAWGRVAVQKGHGSRKAQSKPQVGVPDVEMLCGYN